jgi:hypothetical protein
MEPDDPTPSPDPEDDEVPFTDVTTSTRCHLGRPEFADKE